MLEIEVVWSGVMIYDEDRRRIKAVFYGGIVSQLREKNFCGSVNDYIAVGFKIEFVSYARPIWEIVKISINSVMVIQ